MEKIDTPKDAPELKPESIPELDKLETKAREAELEGASRSLFEPGEIPTKSKRGRKPGGKNKPKVDSAQASQSQSGPLPGADSNAQTAFVSFDTKAAMKGLFGIFSGVLVRSTRCPEVALLPEEIDALGEAWGGVANQYAPAVLAKHGPLIFALTITGGVAIRITSVMEAEIKKRQRFNAAANTDAANQNVKENTFNPSGDFEVPGMIQ